MKASPEWTDIPVGVLSDESIIKANDTLFEAGFDEASAKQSHYECAIGDRIIWPHRPEEDRNQSLAVGEKIILPPFSTAVVITAEQFTIPHDCVARFLLKGKFFTVGIVPVNTYADPGFQGRMGIVLNNTSHRYVKLSRGDRIAKVEFEKLPAQVIRPYAGQHGYGTEHWPVVAQFFATRNDLANARINPDSFSELEASYGIRVAEMNKKVSYYARVVWMQLAIAILLMIGIFALSDEMGTATAVILGIIANILTAALVTGSYKFMPAKWRDRLERH